MPPGLLDGLTFHAMPYTLHHTLRPLTITPTTQEIEALRAKQRRQGIMVGLTPSTTAAAAGAATTAAAPAGGRQQLPQHTPGLEQQLRASQQQQQQVLPVSSSPPPAAGVVGRPGRRQGGGILALVHVPSTPDTAAAAAGVDEGAVGAAATAGFDGWGGPGGWRLLGCLLVSLCALAGANATQGGSIVVPGGDDFMPCCLPKSKMRVSQCISVHMLATCCPCTPGRVVPPNPHTRPCVVLSALSAQVARPASYLSIGAPPHVLVHHTHTHKHTYTLCPLPSATAAT
jgi:hypothetical protein